MFCVIQVSFCYKVECMCKSYGNIKVVSGSCGWGNTLNARFLCKDQVWVEIELEYFE
jgi:hypothetical protein